MVIDTVKIWDVFICSSSAFNSFLLGNLLSCVISICLTV